MQSTLINGNRYSFVNLDVDLAGIPIAKGVFKSINYDAMQEPGIVQGNQIPILGRTAGYGTATGSFEMQVSEFDDFCLELTEGGFLPIMSVDFNIGVTYSVNDIDNRQDQLIGVRITKIGSNNAQGTESTTKTCDIQIAQLVLNNILAFASPFGP